MKDFRVGVVVGRGGKKINGNEEINGKWRGKKEGNGGRKRREIGGEKGGNLGEKKAKLGQKEKEKLG